MTHITKGMSIASHSSPRQSNATTVNNNITVTSTPSQPIGLVNELRQRAPASPSGDALHRSVPTQTNEVLTHDVNVDEVNPYNTLPQPNTPLSVDCEVEFLRRLIMIYMNQPVHFKNAMVVCSVTELSDLVTLLTGCDSVSIETSDIDVDCGCCGLGDDKIDTSMIPIRDVDKIWVTTGDTTSIFKYAYANLLFMFERYRISLKFIHD